MTSEFSLDSVSLPGDEAYFHWVVKTSVPTFGGEPGWWIDDIVIRVNGEVVAAYDFDTKPAADNEGYFIAKLGGELDAWDWVLEVPDRAVPMDIAIDKDDRLVVVGDKEDGGVTAFPLQQGGNETLSVAAGAFIAELRDTGLPGGGGTGLWQWARSTRGGEGRAVFSDTDGSTYLTGPFSGTFQREAGAPALTSAGDDDIFIARLDIDGNWFAGDPDSPWGDGRSAVQAGGPGADSANAISGNGARQLYVSGSYSEGALFGTATLPAVDGKEAMVVVLDRDGRFGELTTGETVVGEAVVAPAGAELSQAAFLPDFFVNGEASNALGTYFKWSPPEANGGTAKLVAIRALPGFIEPKLSDLNVKDLSPVW